MGDMKHRKQRIAWSVAWGVLAVLLCVLWVRSYRWINQSQYKISNTWAFVLVSERGAAMIATMRTNSPIVSSFYTEELRNEDQHLPKRSQWGLLLSDPKYEVRVPHWFLVLLSATLATGPWIRRLKWQFSLRGLLITTTMIALALGLIVWASK